MRLSMLRERRKKAEDRQKNRNESIGLLEIAPPVSPQVRPARAPWNEEIISISNGVQEPPSKKAWAEFPAVRRLIVACVQCIQLGTTCNGKTQCGNCVEYGLMCEYPEETKNREKKSSGLASPRISSSTIKVDDLISQNSTLPPLAPLLPGSHQAQNWSITEFIASAEENLKNASGIMDEISSLGDEKAFLSIAVATGWNLHINRRDDDGWSALHFAAKHGLTSATKLLLEKGADVNQEENTRNDTALSIAVRNQHAEVVRLLLESGADVHTRTAQGYTTLAIAAKGGSEDVLRLLLQYGAEVNERSRESGPTALHSAALAGKLGTVNLLLNSGADPLLEYENCTAKDLAMRHNHIEVWCRLFQAMTEQLDQGQAVGEGVAVSLLKDSDALLEVEKSGQDRASHGLSAMFATQPSCLSVSRSGPSTAESSGQIQDNSARNTGQSQMPSMASRSTFDAADRLKSLSIQDVSEVHYGHDFQEKSVSSELGEHHPRSLDQSVDGARKDGEMQGNQAEPETIPQAREQSESPSTDFTDSTECEGEGISLSSSLDFEKQHTLEVLMAEFYAIWAVRGQGETNSTQSQQAVVYSGSQVQTSSPSRYASGKSRDNLVRGKRLPPDENSDGEDGDGDGRKKPKRSDDSKIGDPVRLLSCPYYKRDPATFCQIGSCTGPGFKSVSRVKEHLYRRHISPQCARCGKIFKEQEDLNSHLRSGIQCEVHEITDIAIEGLCQRKLKLLKCKKRNEDDPSEEGRWRDVFRILFPGAPVPTPYFEIPSQVVMPGSLPTAKGTKVESFEHFSNTYLPGLVENRLVHVICERYKRLMEEEIKNSLPDIIKTSISELLEAWKKSATCDLGASGAALIMDTSARLVTTVPTKTVPNGDPLMDYPLYSEDHNHLTLPDCRPQMGAGFEEQDSDHNPVVGRHTRVNNGGDNGHDDYQNHQDISDSGYVNVQDYRCTCQLPFDTLPEFSFLPEMSNTLNTAPDSQYHLPLESDASLLQTGTWDGNFELTASIGKGKGPQADLVEAFPGVCGTCLGIL